MQIAFAVYATSKVLERNQLYNLLANISFTWTVSELDCTNDGMVSLYP
jgi:hypothetical protein